MVRNLHIVRASLSEADAITHGSELDVLPPEEELSQTTLIWRAIKLPIYSVAVIPLSVSSFLPSLSPPHCFSCLGALLTSKLLHHQRSYHIDAITSNYINTEIQCLSNLRVGIYVNILFLYFIAERPKRLTYELNEILAKYVVVFSLSVGSLLFSLSLNLYINTGFTLNESHKLRKF